MTKTIDVEIYGQRYAVNGEADESYVKQLADIVDKQMKQVAANMRSATPAKLAVLAAFNLAHELMESERRFRQDEAAGRVRAAAVRRDRDGAHAGGQDGGQETRSVRLDQLLAADRLRGQHAVAHDLAGRDRAERAGGEHVQAPHHGPTSCARRARVFWSRKSTPFARCKPRWKVIRL